MATIRTPGFYIDERSASPASVVEVATAVPAFVGHTRQAEHAGESLRNRPWRIGSMAEYVARFGAGPDARFSIGEHADAGTPAEFNVGGTGYDLSQPPGAAGGRFLLPYAMQHFFQNGGGACYVVSVGGFDVDVTAAALTAGIESLTQEPEPTMLVVPDAVLLPAAECATVQQAMLAHCGGLMRNRMAILDVRDGGRDRRGPFGDPVAAFRDSLGADHLGFAAAYYPWVHTTVVDERELDGDNLLDPARLASLIRTELGLPLVAEAATPQPVIDCLNVLAQVVEAAALPAAERTAAFGRLHPALRTMSPLYTALLAAARRQLNLLPPSAAMAGVWTVVDNTRGVWKAPANVALTGVVAPAVSMTDLAQDDLNVSADGKSVNAIRAFAGRGVRVWGGRTLDGNSAEGRYISVRRTMIMLEQSCRLALRSMVFEPNDARTWGTVKGLLENHLTGLWKRGGLAGAVPDEAFAVKVGRGETMTDQDVAEGRLCVLMMVALSRPAEFIVIRFEQRMQAA